MRRINTGTASPNLHGMGKAGFVDQDGSNPPTDINKLWLNSVQEEMMTVIEDVGGGRPQTADSRDFNQFERHVRHYVMGNINNPWIQRSMRFEQTRDRHTGLLVPLHPLRNVREINNEIGSQLNVPLRSSAFATVVRNFPWRITTLIRGVRSGRGFWLNFRWSVLDSNGAWNAENNNNVAYGVSDNPKTIAFSEIRDAPLGRAYRLQCESVNPGTGSSYTLNQGEGLTSLWISVIIEELHDFIL